jgi:DNA polymerase (family 10)
MELKLAKTIAGDIVNKLTPHCQRIEVAGSIRRRKEYVRDIDIVLIPSNQGQLLAALQGIGQIAMGGNKLIRVKTPYGIDLDIYIADERTWATLLLIRTGSKKHNIKLCTLAKKLGMTLHADGSGLFRLSNVASQPYEARVAGDSEESIFEALGLAYVPPEKRE